MTSEPSVYPLSSRIPGGAPALPPPPHPRFPTGTVTLLFSDIEGSTRLLQRLGAAEYARVLGAQRRLLRAAFQCWGGEEVGIAGDGSFTVFARAWPAVMAAVAAQRALAAHPWPDGGQVRVRMGLHTGAPALFEEGYVGLDVHLTARICAAAQGGQILVSRATQERVQGMLPAETCLRDIGAHRLKDFDSPEPLAELHAACPASPRPQSRHRMSAAAACGPSRRSPLLPLP